MSVRLERIPKGEREHKMSVDVPNWTDEDVERVKCIGRGAYGCVYLVKNKLSQEMFVCKEMTEVEEMDTDYQLKLFEKEIRLLSKLNHENVMSLVAYHKPRKLFMDHVVYDWRGDGLRAQTSDLYSFIRTQMEIGDGVRMMQEKYRAAERIAADVSAGLRYLHQQGMSHRDLKPQNILLGNNKFAPFVCRITDFGEARGQGHEGRTMANDYFTNRFQRGTLSFMAPEILHPESARYGGRPLFLSTKEHDDLARIDVWAFGMILHMVINPDMASPYGEHEDLYQAVISYMEDRKVPKHSDKFPFLKSECPKIVEAIKESLQYNPLHRKDMKQLSKLLEGSWERSPVLSERENDLPEAEDDEIYNDDQHPTVIQRGNSHDTVQFVTAIQQPVAVKTANSDKAEEKDETSGILQTTALKNKDYWPTILTQINDRHPGDKAFMTLRTKQIGQRQELEQGFEPDEMTILKRSNAAKRVGEAGLVARVKFTDETVIINGTSDEIYRVNCLLYDIIDKHEAQASGFEFVKKEKS